MASHSSLHSGIDAHVGREGRIKDSLAHGLATGGESCSNDRSRLAPTFWYLNNDNYHGMPTNVPAPWKTTTRFLAHSVLATPQFSEPKAQVILQVQSPGNTSGKLGAPEFESAVIGEGAHQIAVGVVTNSDGLAFVCLCARI